MKRRMLNVMSVVSLMMCVAAVVLWARSYRVTDEWSSVAKPGGPVVGFKGTSQRETRVWSTRGQVLLYETETPHVPDRAADPAVAGGYRVLGIYSGGETYGVKLQGERSWVVPGISYSARAAQLIPAALITEPAPPPMISGGLTFTGPTFFAGFRLLAVSWWLPTLLFALLPAVRAWRWRVPARRARRCDQNQCRHCGYDLRATQDRCPECGVPATTPACGNQRGRETRPAFLSGDGKAE